MLAGPADAATGGAEAADAEPGVVAHLKRNWAWYLGGVAIGAAVGENNDWFRSGAPGNNSQDASVGKGSRVVGQDHDQRCFFENINTGGGDFRPSCGDASGE